jgi:CheY-like chemotaxis protein
VDDAYAAAGARQATVLCIDDDRLVLGVCANALEAYGFRVVIATNGRTGLEIARRERPDLVFLDILMPGSDGLDVCRQLRATPECRDTPVVLLTASTDAALSEAGVEAGAALVMRKPFGPDVIVATAYKVLAHRRAPRTT